MSVRSHAFDEFFDELGMVDTGDHPVVLYVIVDVVNQQVDSADVIGRVEVGEQVLRDVMDHHLVGLLAITTQLLHYVSCVLIALVIEVNHINYFELTFICRPLPLLHFRVPPEFAQP